MKNVLRGIVTLTVRRISTSLQDPMNGDLGVPSLGAGPGAVGTVAHLWQPTGYLRLADGPAGKAHAQAS